MKKGQKVISMDHGVILGILGRQTGLGVARWLFDSELSTRCSGDQDCARGSTLRRLGPAPEAQKFPMCSRDGHNLFIW